MSAALMSGAGCARAVSVLLGGLPGLRQGDRLQHAIGAGMLSGDEGEAYAMAGALSTWAGEADPALPAPAARAVGAAGKRLRAAAEEMLAAKRQSVAVIEAMAQDGALTPTLETLCDVASRIEQETNALPWPCEAITERLRNLADLQRRMVGLSPGAHLTALLAFSRGELLQ